MSAEQAIQDWKRKYEEAADRHEVRERRWERTEELLRRALSRLSIAAQGLDPRLDAELSELRDVVRSSVDEGRLGQLVAGLTETLTEVEEESRARQYEPRQALADLIERIDLPGKSRRRAETLRRRLLSDEGNLAELEEECAALIGEALGQGGKGLFGRLMESSAAEEAEERQEVGEVLLRLLEKLAVPPEFSDRAKSLKQRLLAGVGSEQWRHAVDDLATLIAAMATKAQREKRELEGFVHQMVGRLQELDSHLRGAEELRHESRRSGEELNAEMQARVKEMHTTVQGASSLDQLKLDVQQRMEAIGARMEAFRETESQRHQRSEARMAEMQQRLKSLEAESSELRRRVEQEHHKALHDPLTGLNNRLAFDEQAARELARHRRYDTPLALMVLDIDYFKRVNDTYGHKAGDMVLQTIAQLLGHHLRETDFLARFGGEEFVVLLPETDLDGGLKVAEKLRHEVESCGFHYHNRAVTITTSIGVAQLRGDEGIEAIFERADAALYRAKESGRNRCLGET